MTDPAFLALVWAILAVSLVGSPHCAGMCGPFIAFCVGTEKQSPSRHAAVQCAYHGGRLFSYLLLGVIAGSLGAAANWGGEVLGLQKAAMVAAGAFMLAFGLITLLRVLGVRIAKLGVPGPVMNLFMKGQAFAQNRHPIVRALIIGVLAIFLPCGWLYLFVIWAAGTGSPLIGAAVMLAFWLGTVPILVAVGIGVQSLFGPLRKHLPAAMACLLLFIGAAVIARGFDVDAHGALPTVGDGELSVQAALERVRQTEDEEEPYVPPCCEHEAATDLPAEDGKPD
ncbi:MAG: sulfite exporter TauE/SafE family protein [Phycisphaerales bacterium]|nr:MAG: sulfite exporter TauE/SafE family protein [Phycisphaerales bacterium]